MIKTLQNKILLMLMVLCQCGLQCDINQLKESCRSGFISKNLIRVPVKITLFVTLIINIASKCFLSKLMTELHFCFLLLYCKVFGRTYIISDWKKMVTNWLAHKKQHIFTYYVFVESQLGDNAKFMITSKRGIVTSSTADFKVIRIPWHSTSSDL